MNQILPLIGRSSALFTQDIHNHESELTKIVSESRFLVLGGAGSIGQAVTKEIFKRNIVICSQPSIRAMASSQSSKKIWFFTNWK